METIQDLIDFFTPIPENKWCTNTFEEGKGEDVKRCALGHINHHLCGNAVPDWVLTSNEGRFGPGVTILSKMNIVALEMVHVNNGYSPSNNKRYISFGDDPKTRVLAFLKSKQEENEDNTGSN